MNSGRAWVSDVDYKIHWCHRNWRHRILILSEVFEKGPEKYNLSAGEFAKLKAKYRENEAILERYGFSKNMPDYMQK